MGEASGEISSVPQSKDQLKSPLRKVAPIIKKVAGRIILATPIATLVALSGNADNRIVPESNINKTPTPAVSELSTGMPNSNIDRNNINIPPTPEPTPIPSTPNPTETPKSSEQHRKSEALVIDITKNTFANLGKFGLPTIREDELAKKLGVENLTMEKLTQQIPENEELQLAVLAQIMKQYYGGHGEQVVRAMEETDKLLGVVSPAPQLAGLSTGMIKSFEIERDKIGNPTFWFELDNEELAKIIAQSPRKFINLSLELGRVGIRFKIFETEQANPDAVDPYGAVVIKNETVKNEKDEYIVRSTYKLPDGKQIDQNEYDSLLEEYSRQKIVPRKVINFTPIDAYGQRGNPIDSLAKMADLASKFPDKIFFAAAGNPTLEDGQPITPIILGAKENLVKQGKWPPNLFTIGYYGLEYDGIKYPSGYGPQYHISVDDLDSMDLPWGTSFATPVAGRAIADYFSSKDIEPTPERVREVLDKFSELHESNPVWDSATKRHFEKHDLKVINLKKLTKDLEKSKEGQK